MAEDTHFHGASKVHVRSKSVWELLQQPAPVQVDPQPRLGSCGSREVLGMRIKQHEVLP